MASRVATGAAAGLAPTEARAAQVEMTSGGGARSLQLVKRRRMYEPVEAADGEAAGADKQQ